jgi:ubiquinone/menaquinone biosynthesis C-methylase UbiE
MNDLWSKYAQQFYRERAQLKNDEHRYYKFTKAYKKILGIINDYPQSALLDMGCGCGEMAQAVMGHVGLYCGVDVSFDSLMVAKKRNPHGLFILADMTTFYTNKRFDIATMVSSLEFCHDKHSALKRVHEALRPTGKLYVEVRNSDFLLFKVLAPFMKFLQKVGLIVPYKVDGFKDFSVDEWSQLFSDSGFRIVSKIRSIRPTLYGGGIMRMKNILIKLTSVIAAKNYHYLLGFLCVKS